VESQKSRKPLLIDEARQTGMTYLLQNLFGEEFANVLRVDFLLATYLWFYKAVI